MRSFSPFRSTSPTALSLIALAFVFLAFLSYGYFAVLFRLSIHPSMSPTVDFSTASTSSRLISNVLVLDFPTNFASFGTPSQFVFFRNWASHCHSASHLEQLVHSFSETDPILMGVMAPDSFHPHNRTSFQLQYGLLASQAALPVLSQFNIVTQIEEFRKHGILLIHEPQLRCSDPPVLYDRKRSRVVVLGVARNVASFLPKVWDNIMRVVSFFADWQLIVFENDSSDQTKEILTAWAVQRPGHVHFTTTTLTHVQDRTLRLAIARNSVLSMAHTLFPRYEFIIVVDMDDVGASPFNLTVIQLALDQQIHDWDVISFNHHCYYDIWALRWLGYDINCWNGGLRERGTVRLRKALTVWKQKRQETPPDGLIPVYSAFEGLAIYKANFTWNAYYDGHNHELPKYNEEDCEHVAFHKSMIQLYHARIRVSLQFLSAFEWRLCKHLKLVD